MAVDCRLLGLGEETPGSVFIRFYAWSGPTLSLGRFEPADAVDRDAAQRDGVAIVRRPTGGRVVLHGDDLTYTAVLPKREGRGLQETYGLISEILVDGLMSLGARLDIERGKPGGPRVAQKPCFASVSRHEVTYRGRKVVGSAQRIGDRAVLQHGSIPLGRGYLKVTEYMNVSPRDREGLRSEMRGRTCCLEDVVGRQVGPEEAAAALGAAFARAFDCRFIRMTVDEVMSSEVGPGHPPT